LSATALEQQYEAASAEIATLRAQLQAAQGQLEIAQRQLEWFKRQLFGRKSEKLLELDPAIQQSLLAVLGDELPPAAPEQEDDAPVAVRRRRKRRDGAVNDSGLRFDERVPVRVIEVPPAPELADGEIIGTKSTFRLAQRRASYEILEYRCPVVKLPEGRLKTTPVAGNVFEKSLADVSFVAGLLVDKFCFHLPLYRQHQRLAQAGIQLSRTTLTLLVARAAALLAPIHLAQLEHILSGRVLAMDETPIKAGREGKGKLHAGYFWPLYGEADEISFTFSPTRGRAHIEKVLGGYFAGVLLTDGYAAYARFAEQRPNITHAQCWAHTRRGFEKALPADPAAEQGLLLIGELYAQEAWIREKRLEGPDKQEARLKHCEPRVRAFWRWCDQQCQRPELEPSHPLAKALAYALERRGALEVFLGDPEVPIDTNHLERGLRPIPMGRRNWLFCWSEVGAEHVGIIQSLLSTCRLHGVDPYTYLVDVLQRVAAHPASDVAELTPRLWKQRFATHPLTSDLDRHAR
jgi:transposase